MTEKSPFIKSDRRERSHVEALAHGYFAEQARGSELAQMLNRMPSSALRTAVREKAEDVMAHANFYESGVNLQADMLARRVESLGRKIGELLAQEKYPQIGTESYYQAGERMAKDFDNWASKPQRSASR